MIFQNGDEQEDDGESYNDDSGDNEDEQQDRIEEILEKAQKKKKKEREIIKRANDRQLRLDRLSLANFHLFLTYGRIFAIHRLLYTSCVGQSLNRAILLSLAPKNHFEKKKNVLETLEEALIVFTDTFKKYVEAKPSETIISGDWDFIGRKFCRKKPKITKLEFFLLFIMFLKMHPTLDDHKNSLMKLNFVADIYKFE